MLMVCCLMVNMLTFSLEGKLSYATTKSLAHDAKYNKGQFTLVVVVGFYDTF